MKMATLFEYLLAAAITSFSALAISADTPAGDVKGSKDNPLVRRYEGSTIAYYEKKGYAEFTFLLGTLPKNPDKDEFKSKTMEGAYTRLVYVIPENRSTLEVVRNYQEEVKSKQGKILYECKDGGCGSIQIASYIFQSSRLPGGSTSKAGCVMFPSRIGEQRYTVMELPDSGTNISVVSYTITVQFHPDCKGFEGQTIAIVDIIEPKVREQKMVTVQASEMASAISASGKVALYGIYFDTNMADVKLESDPTLEQVAKLLQNNPALRLLVVGHTDNVGDFTANMALSQRRAASVTSLLVERYVINKERLLPVGVSFASPVGTNSSEEGRAKNRRVELVENTPVNR